MIKIAFHPIGYSEKWFGGTHYTNCILESLKKHYSDKIKCFVSISHSHQKYSEPIKKVCQNLITTPNTNKIKTVITGKNKPEYQSLKSSGIDFLFGANLNYKHTTIPTLSWLWDFQVWRMPEMFSLKEKILMKHLFNRSAKLSAKVVTMSESVCTDAKIFMPRQAHKVNVVRPYSMIEKEIATSPVGSILNKYNIPEKFIYLPNQFWKHKNHLNAFKAIKELKKKKLNISIVCSGVTADYRHKNHFKNLSKYIKSESLTHLIHILGTIPFEDVQQLMTQATAIINPSLFEGCGFSSLEGEAFAKPLLLSDIATHREFHPEALFFDPLDLEDMTQKIALIWEKTKGGPADEIQISQAATIMNTRQKECADSFMKMIESL